MDFIDYDTFDTTSSSTSNDLPAPAPPLVLPINPDITNRFRGLSLLKKTFEFNNQQGEDKVEKTDNDVNATSKIAQKYAKLSIDLLDSTYQQNLNNSLVSDLPTTSSSSSNKNGSSGHSSKTDVLLSTKLSRVLNNYESNDHSLRDALNILQSKRDLDLKELLRSDLLGSIARRRFRSDIESELLKQHTNLLRDFKPVVDRIETLGSKIKELNDINSKLNQIDDFDPDLIRKIEDLSKEKNLIVLKKSILNNFKKNFTLTQYEEHYLTNEDISLEYFEILTKCESIHSNCSILLSLSNPQLGFKIMEKMNGFLSLSYQRISFFLTQQLSNFINHDDNNQGVLTTSSKELRLMKISIFYLSKNLKYFDQVINELIQARSKFITDEFLYQLNNSEVHSSDAARPIAFSGHDPLRYIGDILAYVHALMVNEVEFIQGLLNFDDDEFSSTNESSLSEFERKLIQSENVENLKDSTSKTILQIIDSLNKPLKIRIEQILRSEHDIDTLHKIFNLLDLYKMMYHKQLSISKSEVADQSSILESLDSLKKLSVERIFAILKEQIKLVEIDNDSKGWKIDDDSLLPSDWLRGLLNDGLLVFNSYISSDANILNLKDDEFKLLAGLLIDKPIEFLNKQYKLFSKQDKRSSKIYFLNSLDLIQSKILPIPSLSSKLAEVDELITSNKNDLIQLQYESLLEGSGLNIHQQLIQLIFPIEQIETEDDYLMYSSLIENKLFGRDRLKEIEGQLHEFLPTALIEIQQSLFKISSPSLVNDIISESSLKFLKLYDVFYKILPLLYENESLLEWNASDVATLLGVEDLYRQINSV